MLVIAMSNTQQPPIIICGFGHVMCTRAVFMQVFFLFDFFLKALKFYPFFFVYLVSFI